MGRCDRGDGTAHRADVQNPDAATIAVRAWVPTDRFPLWHGLIEQEVLAGDGRSWPELASQAMFARAGKQLRRCSGLDRRRVPRIRRADQAKGRTASRGFALTCDAFTGRGLFVRVTMARTSC